MNAAMGLVSDSRIGEFHLVHFVAHLMDQGVVLCMAIVHGIVIVYYSYIITVEQKLVLF